MKTKGMIVGILCLILTFFPILSQAFEGEDIKIHGFASTGYIKSDHNNFLVQSEKGSFEFSELEFNFNTFFRNESSVVHFVASEKGAIGYVSAKTEHDAVKMITIE